MEKILIVQATFYTHISKMLLEGATKKLEQLGYKYDVLTVPGALEIPAVIAMAASSKKYAGFVALGCVIRGETTHYDYVCTESAHALSELGYKEKLAVGNGIITVENEAQAIARADINKKNKGGFAANAAVEMVKIKEKFNS